MTGSPRAEAAGREAAGKVRGIVERYREWLPLPDEAVAVSLGEGDTPLVRLQRLEARLGLRVPLFAKVEGMNPTGSFKDRGMAVAVTLAVHEGARAVVCASTGNTAASAAAYAARAGLQALVVLPQGAVAPGKLAQAVAYGAMVAEVEAGFDAALAAVRELARREPVVLVNSVNPARLEGQKTAAFEICDQLGEAPGYLAIPVGNAGNITAYWKGFCEYFGRARVRTRPKMLGFQARGAAPLVLGRPVQAPETVASAIRIGYPVAWEGAVRARDESGGLIDAVSDRAILDAQALLARAEGIFCEPASAASLAGVHQLALQGYFQEATGPVVCVLTGNGLKDPDRAFDMGERRRRVAPDPGALAALLGAA